MNRRLHDNRRFRRGGSRMTTTIDLAELPSFDQCGPIDFRPFNATFTGVQKNGKTVMTTATVSNFPTVTTFTFQGWVEAIKGT
jgi:hypothetical protein